MVLVAQEDVTLPEPGRRSLAGSHAVALGSRLNKVRSWNLVLKTTNIENIYPLTSTDQFEDVH